MLAAANLLVTEFLATNVNSLVDGNGNREDWIEITNADSSAVNLGDYFLSDNDNEPQKWQFPSILLGPGARLVVFASAPLDANGEVIDN